MMTKGHPHKAWPAIEEEEIQAYVDGELEPRRRTEVEAYLAANPSEGERVRTYMEQRVALQALAAPISRQTLPENLDRLRHDLVSALAARRRRSRIARWAGASCLAGGLAIGGWAIFEPGGMVDDSWSAFARRATTAHLSTPPRPSAESGDADLFRWFARRVIQSPASAPDLAAAGFRLAGSQVIPTPDRPNIQLTYANEHKARLTFVLSATPFTVRRDFAYSREGDLSAWYWSRNGLQFGVVGEFGKDRLLDIAKTIDRQMSDVQDATDTKSQMFIAPPNAAETRPDSLGPRAPLRAAEEAPQPAVARPGARPAAVTR